MLDEHRDITVYCLRTAEWPPMKPHSGPHLHVMHDLRSVGTDRDSESSRASSTRRIAALGDTATSSCGMTPQFTSRRDDCEGLRQRDEHEHATEQHRLHLLNEARSRVRKDRKQVVMGLPLALERGE